MLNIYDMTKPIINQIELAKELYTKKSLLCQEAYTSLHLYETALLRFFGMF